MTKLSPAANRQKAERTGRSGEMLAAWFLRLQGFSIRAERIKTPVGEIDLIARRGRLLVFAEVKTRASRHGETAALEAVNPRRIAAAANHYLARHPDLGSMDMRFDVIFLAPLCWPRHVKGAFLAE